jgi:hypothetical protein
MGVMDAASLRQAKKAQGETNNHLDALLAEQRRTNELLAQLVQLLSARPAPSAPPARGPVSWGTQQG